MNLDVLVGDANIFIDLEEGNLTRKFFKLPFKIIVPDILYEEELAYSHNDLLSLGLKPTSLTSNSITNLQSLTIQYPATSRNDCFALQLAKQETCPLLTGDKELRKAAEKEKVVVKGTIWIVEQLILLGLISLKDAKNAFREMRFKSRWLPWEEIYTQFGDF